MAREISKINATGEGFKVDPAALKFEFFVEGAHLGIDKIPWTKVESRSEDGMTSFTARWFHGELKKTEIFQHAKNPFKTGFLFECLFRLFHHVARDRVRFRRLQTDSSVRAVGEFKSRYFARDFVHLHIVRFCDHVVDRRRVF
jgi:hypothetical protein